MQAARVAHPVRPNWLARAILSGFSASVVMLFAFAIAYWLAWLLSGTELTGRRGAEVLQQWFYGLADNVLIDLARPNLYAAIAVHFTLGLTFAVVYAYFFEPRLSGVAWLRGLLFSLVPYALSLLVFLPLVGGGLFGLALGAGPLPLIGNFILHAVYGVTLGVLYGPFGDLITESSLAPPSGEDITAMQSSERAAALGVVVGLGLGTLISVGGLLVAQTSGDGTFLGMHPLVFVVSTALLGASFGGLVGSLIGLPSTAELSER